MVLQQGLPIPVWGWATAGETMTVELAGNRAQAVAGDDGAWKVSLPAMRAGGPVEMVVRGESVITLTNVMIGEVWICSGQSNMEWPLAAVQNPEEEVAAANHPHIRLFTVPKLATLEAPANVDGAWAVCTPETASPFSAVGYFFGRHLQQQLDVPVGLINTSWGGTIAEAWTSRDSLLAEPSLRYLVENFEATLPQLDELVAQYQETLKAWEAQHVFTDPGNAGWAQGFADPETATADWDTMKLPQLWQSAGLNFNGAVWFRKEVDIPAAWAGKPLKLAIGACDKSDNTYFNNVEVGSLRFEDDVNAWCKPRIYAIPAELVQPGKNVIAVRVFSHMYGAGMTGPANIMRLSVADEPGLAISLSGEWQYQVERNFGVVEAYPPAPPQGAGNPNTPCVLYNGMIAPLLPYPIRGAIWYQGESNADRGYEYRTLFPTMIRDWRKAWGLGDFPFYFVQLANFMLEKDEPADSQWAELREAQTMTLSLPNTGMAVIIDIGEALDIHPKNKQDVGLRLALNALAKTYGQPDLPYSGPLFTAAEVEGSRIRVRFDHTTGGLVCRGEQLTAFAIAGEDKQFVWANAVIDGDTVVVSSPDVPTPVAVRYGWAENPPCNLYNGAGLPASPFRTDDWPALVPATA